MKREDRMARRRGFFAELNHQNQQAARRQRQQAAALSRANAAAQREAERARKAAGRAAAAATRGSLAEQKAAEKQAVQMHVEAQLAEVDAKNAALQDVYSQIDGLLAATLEVDDFVDLDTLKVEVTHPPFDSSVFGPASAPLPPLVYPSEPTFEEPPAPRGLGASLGGKRRHTEALAQAAAAHEQARHAWHEHCVRLHADYVAESQRRQQADQQRAQRLMKARAAYANECREREAQAEAHNRELEALKNNLAFDVQAAIQDYVGIVLSNSTYPDTFEVSHEYRFDLESRELTLTVTVPEPSDVLSIKEYRYVKAKDEIVETGLPLREQKERYSNAVWQVALRTLHEVFEADRAGKIHSVALTVDAHRLAPATGLLEHIPLAVVAAERGSFLEFDLSNVVPQATLAHLGAALSKSPYDLVSADTRAGVRVRNPGSWRRGSTRHRGGRSRQPAGSRQRAGSPIPRGPHLPPAGSCGYPKVQPTATPRRIASCPMATSQR